MPNFGHGEIHKIKPVCTLQDSGDSADVLCAEPRLMGCWENISLRGMVSNDNYCDQQWGRTVDLNLLSFADVSYFNNNTEGDYTLQVCEVQESFIHSLPH